MPDTYHPFAWCNLGLFSVPAPSLTLAVFGGVFYWILRNRTTAKQDRALYSMPDAIEEVFWTLDQDLATLRRELLIATVHVSNPDRGLQQIYFRTARPDWQLLCVATDDGCNWPAILTESYVRGADLVSTYQAVEAWPYAPQLYWSVKDVSPELKIRASLGLVVSIQTHLLDTHPLINAISKVPAAETLILKINDDGEGAVDNITSPQQRYNSEWGDCCLLRRLPDHEFSLVEFMPATDFRRLHVSLESDGFCQTRWELFSEFLEKGVIRKAQLQVAMLDVANDIEVAAEWCRRTRARPLPLTT